MQVAPPGLLVLSLNELTVDQESFIEVPGTPKLSSQSRVSQYYHLAPSLDALIAYISERLCSPGTKSWCAELVSLQTASYLDLDYNKASGSVVVKAFWDGAPGDGRWDERIEKLQQIEKVEVGVLHEEKAIRPNEVSLGGILTVLGQDRHPGTQAFQKAFHTPCNGSRLTIPSTYALFVPSAPPRYR